MPPRTSVTDPQAPEEVGNLQDKKEGTRLVAVGGGADWRLLLLLEPTHTHIQCHGGREEGAAVVLDQLQALESGIVTQ